MVTRLSKAAREALASMDWAKIDEMSDADIARQIADNPDATPDMAPEAGSGRPGSVLSRVDAALGGTVRVAAGVNLAAPTGEAWEAET